MASRQCLICCPFTSAGHYDRCQWSMGLQLWRTAMSGTLQASANALSLATSLLSCCSAYLHQARKAVSRPAHLPALSVLSPKSSLFSRSSASEIVQTLIRHAQTHALLSQSSRRYKKRGTFKRENLEALPSPNA